MPRIREVAERLEEYIENLKKRFALEFIPLAEEGVKLWEVWKKYRKEVDNLRHKRNILSEKYAKEKDEKIREEVEKINFEIRKYEATLREIEERIRKIELLLPNWIDKDVPIGPTEDFKKPVRYFGKPKVWKEYKELFEKENPGVEYELIDWKPMHHYDIVKEFGLADMEIAGKIAGSRFYIEKGKLVFLDFAISLYAMEFFKKKGFDDLILIPPYMMRREVEEKITHIETFIDAIYEIKEEDLILIPTSEHPICAIFENKVFRGEELPFRILAWSPAFRKEAGAHGKDTKGIFRVHQFHKVELHSIVPLEEDRKELEFLVKTVEEFLKTLEIPFRTVVLPSGDMDKRARIQYDIECWFPGQGRYRETHSIATMGTWVSEKLNIKVDRKGKRELVANLYATGVAIQRTLLAIFENNYDPEEQVIRIPKVLRKYVDFDVIERVKK